MEAQKYIYGSIQYNKPSINSGSVINTVSVTASSPGKTNDVSDQSDDPNTAALNDPTVVQLSIVKLIEVTKTASVTDNNSNGLNDAGDTINYIITVRNGSSISLTGITLNDTLTDGNGTEISLTTSPTFSSSTSNSVEGTLLSGEIATYTASYIISESSFGSGRVVINTVTVRGSSPGNNNDVIDISDDGDDTDGNTTNDPTIVLMASGEMAIKATKTAEVTDNGDGEINRGDIITYNIQIENIGETIVTNLSIIDNLSDGSGNILSLNNGPFFTGSDQNSIEGILKPGEVASYIAFYIIEQSAADSGKILNSVIATAGTESTSTVSDVSDDGDDSDGNTTDDPTEVFIAPDKLEVTKTARNN